MTGEDLIKNNFGKIHLIYYSYVVEVISSGIYFPIINLSYLDHCSTLNWNQYELFQYGYQ